VAALAEARVQGKVTIVRRLSLIVTLLAIGLPLPLTVLARNIPVDRMRGLLSPPLIDNAEPPSRPALRLATWQRGEFQRGFEPWFASIVVPRGWSVRLTNQLYYSLFARSYMVGGTIIVGREHYLYQRDDLHAYCESARGDGTMVTPLVDEVRELRNLLARRGHPLLFVVSPSKAVTMREFLPADLCRWPVAPDRPRRLLVEKLREAGVPVIDGPDLVREMKARDPLPPFLRGSVHWSQVAGERVAGVLLEEVRVLTGTDLGELTLGSPRWTASPTGTDRDFAELLNLLRPPLDYPTGVAAPICRPTVSGHEARLVAVGDSFLITVLDPIGACGLFKEVDLYFYYTLAHMRWPGGREPVDRAKLRWRKTLDMAAVTVVEINEVAIDHDVPYLHQFLDDAIAALR